MQLRQTLAGIASAGVAVAGTAGCGGGGHVEKRAPAPTTAASAIRPTRLRRTAARLRLVSAARLPAPVQLPGLAATPQGVLAVGGLDAADASTDDVVRVAPGRPSHIGRLGLAVHDASAAALGDTVYAFGGGTAGGPVATITAVDRHGDVRPAGQLPTAMSDTAAASLAGTAYVVGGYTTTAPLRSVLAFRPGHPVRSVATLPHAVRYAAAGGGGGRLLVAGGTDGVHARREIVEVDPARHTARVVATLPSPLAHAAGVVLGSTFYVLGGRGDATGSQRATIWALDFRSGRLRRAGRLPIALSDLSATAAGTRIVVAGGRDAAGRVHDERWSFAAR